MLTRADWTDAKARLEARHGVRVGDRTYAGYRFHARYRRPLGFVGEVAQRIRGPLRLHRRARASAGS